MKYKNNCKNGTKTGANERDYLQPSESEIKAKIEVLLLVPSTLSGKEGKLSRKIGMQKTKVFMNKTHFVYPFSNTPIADPKSVFGADSLRQAATSEHADSFNMNKGTHPMQTNKGIIIDSFVHS